MALLINTKLWAPAAIVIAANSVTSFAALAGTSALAGGAARHGHAIIVLAEVSVTAGVEVAAV
jgi:hypothetical protein